MMTCKHFVGIVVSNNITSQCFSNFTLQMMLTASLVCLAFEMSVVDFVMKAFQDGDGV